MQKHNRNACHQRPTCHVININNYQLHRPTSLVAGKMLPGTPSLPLSWPAAGHFPGPAPITTKKIDAKKAFLKFYCPEGVFQAYWHLHAPCVGRAWRRVPLSEQTGRYVTLSESEKTVFKLYFFYFTRLHFKCHPEVCAVGVKAISGGTLPLCFPCLFPFSKSNIPRLFVLFFCFV